MRKFIVILIEKNKMDFELLKRLLPGFRNKKLRFYSTEEYDMAVIRDPYNTEWKIALSLGDFGYQSYEVDTEDTRTTNNVSLLRYHVLNYPGMGPIGLNYNRRIVEVSRSVNSQLMRDIEVTPEILKTINRRLFEKIVAEIWDAFGYSVELTKTTRDGGFDIIAIKSGVMDEKYLIECKRPDPGHKIGIRPVRELLGVKTNQRATKGILATTSYFTKGADGFFKQHKWELEGKDFDGLVEWLNRYMIIKQIF